MVRGPPWILRIITVTGRTGVHPGFKARVQPETVKWVVHQAFS